MVWLTATLPLALQGEFIKQNKLVRPRVVRESTNRANIKYMLLQEASSILDKTTSLV